MKRDLEHLMMHSTVAEEQLGRLVGAVAGEVETSGVEASGLHAEWVGDFDAAALPGAVTPELGGCRSWCRTAER